MSVPEKCPLCGANVPAKTDEHLWLDATGDLHITYSSCKLPIASSEEIEGTTIAAAECGSLIRIDNGEVIEVGAACLEAQNGNLRAENAELRKRAEVAEDALERCEDHYCSSAWREVVARHKKEAEAEWEERQEKNADGGEETQT